MANTLIFWNLTWVALSRVRQIGFSTKALNSFICGISRVVGWCWKCLTSSFERPIRIRLSE
jgi:hypothetical protein